MTNMGKIKAILVGVSDYSTLKAQPLPWCKNDLAEMKNALVHGLKVEETHILVCGNDGIVTQSNLVSSIITFLRTASKDDILFFYFSGHGSKNGLALSDSLINLQDIVDLIDTIPIACKIVILDSCHSGNAQLGAIPQMDINESIDLFAGHGYAVMASCGADQTSGFDEDRQMSLYTRFVCDALTAPYLVQKGRKSLESINQAVFRFAEVYNTKATNKHKQAPIYRSSIGGTIFFEVETYKPYKAKEIYEETDDYIIYSVKPVKNYKAKQLKVDVLLRYESTFAHIAEYSQEICKKVLYADVYADSSCEKRYAGKPSNIVTCHFGYDETDMVSGSYVCHTVWVDDTQNKNVWYRGSKNTEWINNVFVYKNSSYNALKLLHINSMTEDDLIRLTKEYTANIINASEKVIKQFREYLNGVISEQQLIDGLPTLNAEIRKWFVKQSDLPIPPGKLDKWAKANEALACAAVDFSLYYDKQNVSKWSCDNRKQLMLSAVHKYECALEELKGIQI